MTVIDQIEQLWTDFLAFLSTVVIPDWTGLIALLPVFLVIGVLGPLITLGVLAWLGYGITKPRTSVKRDYGTRVAQLDAGGQPVFPGGEPYCVRDRLVYPSGAQRCDVCRDPLAIQCPRCAVVQSAGIATCGNCGLVLKVEPRSLVVATDGPPPGGAAVA